MILGQAQDSTCPPPDQNILKCKANHVLLFSSSLNMMFLAKNILHTLVTLLTLVQLLPFISAQLATTDHIQKRVTNAERLRRGLPLLKPRSWEPTRVLGTPLSW